MVALVVQEVQVDCLVEIELVPPLEVLLEAQLVAPLEVPPVPEEVPAQLEVHRQVEMDDHLEEVEVHRSRRGPGRCPKDLQSLVSCNPERVQVHLVFETDRT